MPLHYSDTGYIRCNRFLRNMGISLLDIMLIAIGLAMDAFTVAISVGLQLSLRGKISWRQYFRLGFHFGLFQFLMPILGWWAGTTVRVYIEAFDHWIAMALLSYIGVRLIREGRREQPSKPVVIDPTRGSSLILLSAATSIDALALGLSLAFLGGGIIYPAVIIGIVAALFTVAGLFLGRMVGVLWRQRVAWFGGLLLIAIGIKILVEHLFD